MEEIHFEKRTQTINSKYFDELWKCQQLSKAKIQLGWEAWSSGKGRRLTSKRLWVRIPRRILDGCKRFASYYIKEKLKIKVAKWGTSKKYFFFKYNWKIEEEVYIKLKK